MDYEGDDAVKPSVEWDGWDAYDLDYLGEVLNDFLGYLDDAGYFG